ncbi:MAG: hypothetical protein AAFU79_25840, partial [Myxococcota bacterium]
MAEFFVGYADTPPRTKRFALIAGAVLLVVVVAAGLGWALTQRRAGTATWDITTVVERQGILQVSPYGMLHTRDASGGWTTTLLVEDGKLGLRAQASSLDGRSVKVRGTLLGRAGEEMLALVPSADAVLGVSARPTEVAPRVDGGEITLVGRVVDSKCFLGAMKPGDGSGHRPCAELCLKGGIPPVLVTEDPAHPYVLLAAADGGPANIPTLLPKV